MSEETEESEVYPSVVLVSLGLRGGMAQYAAVLANELVESVPVTVVTADSPETQSLFDDRISLRPITVADEESGLHALLVNLRAFLLIQWHLRQADADIVHFPFVAGMPSALATIFACLKRGPVVGTIHDPESHVGQEIQILRWDLREVFVKATTHLLNAVIVHGETCRDQAHDLGYPMEKVHVLPHGLYSHYNEVDAGDTDGCEHDVAGTNTDEDIKPSSNEGESNPEDPTLLFFGKIRPNKGFDRVPELLDAVSEEVPDVRAVVAGSPDVAPQIDDNVIKQTLESLRAHNRVELQAEYIPNEEVPEYFNQATAVVLPYYDATVSGVAMIAYAFETPIVATRTGDLGPMVERDGTGLLANPESTEELAERIIELLNDDDLRAELTTNVKRAREDYSWSHIANQTIDLYRNVLDR